MQVSLCHSQIRTFAIDRESSVVSFSVSHLGFLTVEGAFSEFSGTCTFKGDSLLAVEGTILVRSIDTDDASRDKSLKSDAYLNSEEYPEITFRSTEVIRGPQSRGLRGVLKLTGIEKELTMPLSYRLSYDKKQCFIDLKTSINRADFELDFGAMDALVGDVVEVEISITSIRN